MKRLFIILLFLFTSISLFAQEHEEEIEIVIIEEPSGPTYRAPAVIPLSCFYYPSLDTIYLTFMSDLGASAITVISVSTGTIDNYIQNGAGLCVIPISSSGLTYIDIYTEDGHHYRTIFIA
ncbi:MAG: hypothetical protein IJ151_04870 [Bacteroidales bacterium]|nr:hypothetical protein [Bacteroidales bacterium]